MSSFRVIHLQSSALVTLRVFSRGCCYSYPGLTHAETEACNSKATDPWLVQGPERVCSLGFQPGACYKLSYK